MKRRITNLLLATAALSAAALALTACGGGSSAPPLTKDTDVKELVSDTVEEQGWKDSVKVADNLSGERTQKGSTGKPVVFKAANGVSYINNNSMELWASKGENGELKLVAKQVTESDSGSSAETRDASEDEEEDKINGMYAEPNDYYYRYLLEQYNAYINQVHPDFGDYFDKFSFDETKGAYVSTGDIKMAAMTPSSYSKYGYYSDIEIKISAGRLAYMSFAYRRNPEDTSPQSYEFKYYDYGDTSVTMIDYETQEEKDRKPAADGGLSAHDFYELFAARPDDATVTKVWTTPNYSQNEYTGTAVIKGDKFYQSSTFDWSDNDVWIVKEPDNSIKKYTLYPSVFHISAVYDIYKPNDKDYETVEEQLDGWSRTLLTFYRDFQGHRDNFTYNAASKTYTLSTPWTDYNDKYASGAVVLDDSGRITSLTVHIESSSDGSAKSDEAYTVVYGNATFTLPETFDGEWKRVANTDSTKYTYNNAYEAFQSDTAFKTFATDAAADKFSIEGSKFVDSDKNVGELEGMRSYFPYIVMFKEDDSSFNYKQIDRYYGSSFYLLQVSKDLVIQYFLNTDTGINQAYVYFRGTEAELASDEVQALFKNEIYYDYRDTVHAFAN